MASDTLIAVPLVAETTAEARKAMDDLSWEADLVELRLDLMARYDLPALLADRPCPVIVTNRPVSEGGRYEGDESARVAALLEAAQLGADYIDCEMSSLDRLAGCDLGDTKLIVSCHRFDGMYEDMVGIYDVLAQSEADIVKVVCTAQRITDAADALQVMRQAQKPVIAITMGDLGYPSRVLAGKYGAYLTFASVEQHATAPGQVAVSTLLEVYGFDWVDKATAVCGYLCTRWPDRDELMGMNHALHDTGRDALVVPLLLGDEDPEVTKEAYRAIGFDGFSEIDEDLELLDGDWATPTSL